MSARQDRTRETLPDVAGAGPVADIEQVSAVRETAQRPAGEAQAIEAAGASAPGPGRAFNEDAFVTLPDLGLCVVADGIGGHPVGEMAARVAVTEIERFFTDSDPKRTPPMAWDVTRGLAAGMLARAVDQANRAVHAAGLRDAQRNGMCAAVAALLVAGPRAVVAHVGDVRVYRVRGGGLEKLTEDHSQGELHAKWPGEAADPVLLAQRRRVLTRALGRAPTVRVVVRVEQLQAGDAFLMCSDGLWGRLTHDTMAAVIRQSSGLPEAAAALVARALEAGGQGDVTAVLVRPLRSVSGV